MYQNRAGALSKHGDFFLLDVLCFLLSYVLAYLFRHGMNGEAPRIYINAALFLVLFNFLVSFFAKEFSGVLSRSFFREAKQVVRTKCLVFAAVIAYLFLSKQSAAFSRIVMTVAFVLTLSLTLLARTLWKQLLRHWRDKKALPRVLVVTTSDLVRDGLERLGHPHLYIKGIVLLDDGAAAESISGVPVVADADSVMDYVCAHVVDEVFLYTNQTNAVTQQLTHALLEAGVTVHIVLDCISKKIPNMFVESFGDMTVMTGSVKVVHPLELALKRMMDIAGGLAGCVLTALLFVFVAPAIYRKSPGPIFFSQIRVGKNGRKFKFYKFRSMHLDAEERKKDLLQQNEMQGLMFKMENDPRVIPGIGAFIRRTSIDEFPQFWNVLKGDMSLVGTRPPTVDEYEQYDAHHKSRLAIKPGVTGLWQVSGRNKIRNFEEIVELDNQYIQNWSLSLDIKLLWKTLQVVCRQDGAQ